MPQPARGTHDSQDRARNGLIACFEFGVQYPNGFQQVQQILARLESAYEEKGGIVGGRSRIRPIEDPGGSPERCGDYLVGVDLKMFTDLVSRGLRIGHNPRRCSDSPWQREPVPLTPEIGNRMGIMVIGDVVDRRDDGAWSAPRWRNRQGMEEIDSETFRKIR